MLIAETSEGKRVNLSQLSREEITGLKKKKHYCPGCKSEIIVKNGTVIMPHFAHKKNSQCFFFSENESEEHLVGKKLIAANCEKYGIDYELEAFLPELQQRPDVLINRKIAVEFQCSPLSIARFKERTINYQAFGYQVLWILGTKLQWKDSCSSMQRQFVYLSKNIGFYVWELDISKKEIRNNYFLVSSIWKKFYQTQLFSLEKESVIDILQFPLKNHEEVSYEIASKVACEKRIHCWNQQLNQKSKSSLQLQEFFYQEGLNLRELPVEIMLPSFQSVLLKEQELIWRFQIYQRIQRDKKMSYQSLYRMLKQNFDKNYPLISDCQLIKYHLSLYLCFLLQNKLIIEKEGYYYPTNKKFTLKKTSQEFLGIPLKYGMINK
ncbi:competence protein CoiA [Vagococcus hydrophili]|uniref:Competence protein CoiA n=1 Tax=Vagococcus hydrophili TaxID=2714947 RepID=A0A6G8ARM2_9ENTE|nr:competence protein CoiA family protein [Vagococcus hydrophili]QIL47619.1 hypothetical protein G7082_03240 [Vagococcus hydrophili]